MDEWGGDGKMSKKMDKWWMDCGIVVSGWWMDGWVVDG